MITFPNLSTAGNSTDNRATYVSNRAIEAAELMKLYKREFGDNWQTAFAQTVKIFVS